MIIPEGRLSYLNVFEEGYHESGAKSLNLHVKNHTSSFLQPEAFLKFLHEFYLENACLLPMVKVGYVAKIPLSSSTYKATMSVINSSSSMSVKSFDRITNQLVVGAGVLYKTFEHLFIKGEYEAQLFDNLAVYEGRIKVDWTF